MEEIPSTHRHLPSVSSAALGQPPDLPTGLHEFEYVIAELSSYPGVYSVRLVFLDECRRMSWYAEIVKSFQISSARANTTTLPALRLTDVQKQWKFGWVRQILASPRAAGLARQST